MRPPSTSCPCAAATANTIHTRENIPLVPAAPCSGVAAAPHSDPAAQRNAVRTCAPLARHPPPLRLLTYSTEYSTTLSTGSAGMGSRAEYRARARARADAAQVLHHSNHCHEPHAASGHPAGTATLGATASAEQGDGAEALTGLDCGRARFVHSSVDSVRALRRKCRGHRPHDLVS